MNDSMNDLHLLPLHLLLEVLGHVEVEVFRQLERTDFRSAPVASFDVDVGYVVFDVETFYAAAVAVVVVVVVDVIELK